MGIKEIRITYDGWWNMLIDYGVVGSTESTAQFGCRRPNLSEIITELKHRIE